MSRMRDGVEAARGAQRPCFSDRASVCHSASNHCLTVAGALDQCDKCLGNSASTSAMTSSLCSSSMYLKNYLSSIRSLRSCILSLLTASCDVTCGPQSHFCRSPRGSVRRPRHREHSRARHKTCTAPKTCHRTRCGHSARVRSHRTRPYVA